jgi:HTH-type transcriptional regulator, global nitrogen regulator NrpRI
MFIMKGEWCYNMMDPQIERKLIEIMRVIHESDKPIGARAIADELNNRGYDIGERAVRYHLRILDERGFTHKHGYAGRTLTELGESEMNDALIGDRFGFVISRIEEMAFRTTYNPETGDGVVAVNISYFDKDDMETVIDVISYTAHAGYMISSRVKIFEEDDESIYMPPGKVGIATVCSVTFDGLLLKAGIPVEPAYGGILQIESQKPSHFLDLISYSGTSIDPIQIFMKRKTTSVLEVLDKGEGRILANMRQINSSAYEKTFEIIKTTEKVGLGGWFPLGEIDELLYGAPVETGKFGVSLVGGINGICALEESGIKIETHPVSTVLEYRTMSEI